MQGVVTGSERYQTLLGATGTGKTFTIANVMPRYGDRYLFWRTTKLLLHSFVMNSANFPLMILLNILRLIRIAISQTLMSL